MKDENAFYQKLSGCWKTVYTLEILTTLISTVQPEGLFSQFITRNFILWNVNLCIIVIIWL